MKLRLYNTHFQNKVFIIHYKYMNKKQFRPIAMKVLAAGAIRPKEAIEYLGQFSKIESVLFGNSSKGHIRETKELIENSL